MDDFVTLRKGKATADQAREMLLKPNYFGTMLVKEGLADALLGGATYSTADTVRPALQLIKTREGASLVSSCMILIRGDERFAMGDCAINVSYEDKLDDQGNSPQHRASIKVITHHSSTLTQEWRPPVGIHNLASILLFEGSCVSFLIVV